MAAQTAFTVFDGASTPVSHTFTEDGVSTDGMTQTAAYKELNASLPEEALIRYYETKQKLKSGVVKTQCLFVVSVMENVLNQNAQGYTAAPKKAYEDRAMFVLMAHPRSTEGGRRLVRQLVINKVNNTATTVTPAVGGSAAVLLDKLVVPS